MKGKTTTLCTCAETAVIRSLNAKGKTSNRPRTVFLCSEGSALIVGRTEDFKESDKHVLELNKGLGCTHCEGGIKPHSYAF